MNRDINEAVRILASNPEMRSAGLDEAFANEFSKNIEHLDKLVPSSREKIKDQFGAMTFELQTLEKVARKHCPEKNQALARWLTGVNLLLVMAKHSPAPTA